jgi:hypothetical protein
MGEERKLPIATNAPISPQRFDSAVRQGVISFFGSRLERLSLSEKVGYTDKRHFARV